MTANCSMIRRASVTRASPAQHDGGSHRETHKLKSIGFRLWLLHVYYRNTSGAPNSNAMSIALNTLPARPPGMTDLSAESSSGRRRATTRPTSIFAITAGA